jgi:hypothetical protein
MTDWRKALLFGAVVAGLLHCSGRGSMATARSSRTLREVLGDQKIAQITQFAFQDLELRQPVNVEPSFWPEIWRRVGDTDVDNDIDVTPEHFLDEGFRAFLVAYVDFFRRDGAARVTFSAAGVNEFLNSTLARCDGPCRVPPCCGKPSRCLRCEK